MSSAKFQKTAAWLLTEMIVEIQDVEQGKKATKKAINWIIQELDEHFQGFASEDRVSAWKRALLEVDLLMDSQAE